MVEQEREGHERLCALYRRRPSAELVVVAGSGVAIDWPQVRAARRVLAERRMELVTACGPPSVAELRWRMRRGLT